MTDPQTFVFMTCQVGAESALKQEVARQWSRLRFAFSRPGFLTFKVPAGTKPPDDFVSKLVFARAAGVCLGKVTAVAPSERADLVWKLIGDRNVTQLHVWPRDRYSPGFREYEPGMTAEAVEAERIIRERAPARFALGLRHPPCPSTRSGGERGLVADVVIVDDREWWVGHHERHSLVSSWPGGLCQAALPSNAVSRAYLKMQEALLWSGFQVRPGERCVEIGSAPGGASQFLLAQGLDVIGVDPAEIDPAIRADPHFRHIRKRSKEVPRSEFLGVDWLTCDVNLPPNYTLDAVKAIVGHAGVKFQGLLLTLKLVDWSLASEIPNYLDRIRSWGFKNVRARQLHHNRQEICLAASGFRMPSVKPDRVPRANRDTAPRQRSSAPKKRAANRLRKRPASD